MSKIWLSLILVSLASLLFAGGGTEDQTGKISPEQAKALLQSDTSVVLLDVRTAEEFTPGHIAGARLIPYDSINAAKAAALIPNFDSKVVVYCRSGHRSGIAVRTLRDLGYRNVLDLGGLMQWPYPLVNGAP